jgi:hypothetical protein
MIARGKELIISAFQRVPIIGPLHRCSKESRRRAFQETLLFLVFSTMPLWLLPVLGELLFASAHSMLTETLKLAEEGELFVYSAATLGPLLFMIVSKYGEKKEGDDELFSYTINFPNGQWFIIFALSICVISGFSFGVIRIPELHSQELPLSNYKIIILSEVLFALSIVSLFSASAYRNYLEEFIRESDINGDSDFARRWREARGAD